LSAPEGLAPELSRLLRETQRDQRIPSLSAGVFRDGEIAWAEAIGLADVEAPAGATPDTQYAVASITKTFTAAAVMQLRNEGKLDLDDPLSAHVPESAHGAPAIRRLLSHVSGLQRELPGLSWETLEFESMEALLGHLEDAEQVLPPGRRFHYSNLAFALLGEVVARRSGSPYKEFVEARFLGPLGLRRTTWQAEEPFARGYLTEPYSDAVRDEPDLQLNADTSAGQLWSTTADLCCWGSFLADPDPAILKPETAEEMRSVQVLVDERWTEGYGLGLSLDRRGERVFTGHEGGMPGQISRFAFLPRERIAVATLSNGGDLGDLGLRLAELVADALPAEVGAWRPGAEPPEELASALGVWWSEDDQWAFSFRNGRLEARRPTGPAGEETSVFDQEGLDRFRAVSGPERGELLTLVRDDSGTVVKLYWATYPFYRDSRPTGG
jgi:CubicO group peptidase (beta-lactamase class C family)